MAVQANRLAIAGLALAVLAGGATHTAENTADSGAGTLGDAIIVWTFGLPYADILRETRSNQRRST
jgi:hypothetical protein